MNLIDVYTARDKTKGFNADPVFTLEVATGFDYDRLGWIDFDDDDRLLNELKWTQGYPELDKK